MQILFSHGKESGPWGLKITRLAEVARAHGFTVDSIDYTDTPDPDKRVTRLSRQIPQYPSDELILVGSSMGGYVSLVASKTFRVKAMFLMAPALYMPGYKQDDYATLCPQIDIVHGWSDEIIPYKHSIRYASQSQATLHLIEGDHALNQSMPQLSSLFEGFLHRV